MSWLQSQVAAEIGVDVTTICNWETQRCQPETRHMPKIIAFLGYTQYRPPASFGEWLRMVRTSFGYSQETLAEMIDVDESTVAKWERSASRPTKKSRGKLRKLWEPD